MTSVGEGLDGTSISSGSEERFSRHHRTRRSAMPLRTAARKLGDNTISSASSIGLPTSTLVCPTATTVAAPDGDP